MFTRISADNSLCIVSIYKHLAPDGEKTRGVGYVRKPLLFN